MGAKYVSSLLALHVCAHILPVFIQLYTYIYSYLLLFIFTFTLQIVRHALRRKDSIIVDSDSSLSQRNTEFE